MTFQPPPPRAGQQSEGSGTERDEPGRVRCKFGHDSIISDLAAFLADTSGEQVGNEWGVKRLGSAAPRVQRSSGHAENAKAAPVVAKLPAARQPSRILAAPIEQAEKCGSVLAFPNSPIFRAVEGGCPAQGTDLGRKCPPRALRTSRGPRSPRQASCPPQRDRARSGAQEAVAGSACRSSRPVTINLNHHGEKPCP